ncbi:hypothetical protein PILCRDRAFT_5018 [Piloderma croceum F 1598]|uniref:Uncharacterized protein n=1 Tax=Piloderma croceum (strain F 1598) TaxID=765440 RepID=A0A0C3BHW4_PILCF|nr:hypothetical protein PILCRDRAFT_5018 [Piloderma croceum F 1598]
MSFDGILTGREALKTHTSSASRHPRYEIVTTRIRGIHEVVGLLVLDEAARRARVAESLPTRAGNLAEPACHLPSPNSSSRETIFAPWSYRHQVLPPSLPLPDGLIAPEGGICAVSRIKIVNRAPRLGWDGDEAINICLGLTEMWQKCHHLILEKHRGRQRSHWEGEQDGACEYGHAAPKDHLCLFNGAHIIGHSGKKVVLEKLLASLKATGSRMFFDVRIDTINEYHMPDTEKFIFTLEAGITADIAAAIGICWTSWSYSEVNSRSRKDELIEMITAGTQKIIITNKDLMINANLRIDIRFSPLSSGLFQ